MVSCPPKAPISKSKPESYGRPDAIEDATNKYFIHPLSTHLVTLGLKLKLSPNFVSLLGLACGLLAAVFYYQLPQEKYVVAGFICMVFWHILDGADGKLARATGKASAFGRIIDGICDHLVFGAVYISLTLHLLETGYSLSIWWLVIAAGISHAVQAAGYEERRQKYQRRLKGLSRSDVQEDLLAIKGKRSFLAGLYDSAQRLVSNKENDLDKRLKELEADQHIAASLIERTVPMVRAWGLLNANNRTILIFIFAAMGQPIFYFAFELIVLNFILIVLLIAERQQEKKIAALHPQHETLRTAI